MKKDQKKTNTTHTLVINGEPMTFKFTLCKDGRMLYRPTADELSVNPRLKTLHKTRLADMLDAILDAFQAESKPKEKHFFNDELIEFLRAFKQKGTKPNRASTYANVEFTATHYIMPYFENLLIRDVSVMACNKMISSLLEKGYSKSVIDKAYLYTNEFLEYLVFEDVIAKNPLKKVSKPSPEHIANARLALNKQPNKQRHYLNDEEINKIRNVIYNGYDVEQKSKSGKTFYQRRYFSQPEVYDFLLNTGLRTGELLALKYEHWDKENKTIDIQSARVTYIERDEEGNGKTVTVETNPKNAASKTVLRLTDKANDILHQLIEKEPEGYTGYIVHTEAGGPLTVRSFEGRLERVIKAAGLHNVSPHDFRHTFASVLWEQSNGNIQYIKTKMRHKDATTTSNIYIDLRKEKEEELDKQINI